MNETPLEAIYCLTSKFKYKNVKDIQRGNKLKVESSKYCKIFWCRSTKDAIAKRYSKIFTKGEDVVKKLTDIT